MAEIDLSQYDLTKARNGVILAVNKIVEHLINGERFTAIVLPTRYGKSDVIRLSTYVSYYRGLIATALAISPGTILAAQLVNDDKVAKTIERYDLQGKFIKKKLTRIAGNFTPNQEMLTSTTIQLVQQNLSAIQQWIDSMANRTGRPVLVFIDESQMESDTNQWGKVTTGCAAAGAMVVNATATPWRSNNQKIPGFKYETISESTIRRSFSKKIGETNTKNIIETKVYDITETEVAIIPDVEVTFREAWRVENPPCLCFINRVPFDVPLLNLTNIDPSVGTGLLSELSESAAKSILGQVVRDPMVMDWCARELVQKIKERRQIHRLIRGIVFTANDRASLREQNKHATDMKQKILRYAPEFKILILTMKNEEEDETAERMMTAALSETEMPYDVIIVKQMGTVGVDCKWLKVAADLSTIRQAGSFIQRLTRIATISPDDDLLTADYITVNDIMGLLLYKFLIEEMGGALDISARELIETFIDEKDKKLKKPGPLYLANGAEYADFQDTKGNEADKSYAGPVSILRQLFPGISAQQTDPEIADVIIANFPSAIDDLRKRAAGAVVVDTEVIASDLRQAINQIADRATNSLYYGVRKLTYIPELWGATRKEIFTEVWRRCRISRGEDLGGISDVNVLERIRREARGYEGEIDAAKSA